MTAPVVFVDTETLGLDPDYNPIWEVALITPDGQEHEWFLRVSPRDVALAHPKALEIGRFDERYDNGKATDHGPFCHRFRDLTAGCHLAGAVVSFDEERLRRLFWRNGYGVEWHYHLIDVEALAVGYLAGVEFGARMAPPWKSEELSRAVNVDPEDFDRHTALGDARWAKAIYEAVMDS